MNIMNKEELDVDIVIGNENARIAAGTLASERADQHYGSVAA